MATWVDVTATDAIGEGGRWFACREGREIALFRVRGQVYAIEDSCPHAGASLASAELEGATISCRAHGLKFDLRTGCQRGGGLTACTYPTREQDGRLQVDIEGSGSPAP